jgi:hypothetical protein
LIGDCSKILVDEDEGGGGGGGGDQIKNNSIFTSTFVEISSCFYNNIYFFVTQFLPYENY